MRRHLLSVPLSAGEAARRPSGRLIGLGWKWSRRVRSAQLSAGGGPHISVLALRGPRSALQTGVLKKENRPLASSPLSTLISISLRWLLA